MFVIRASPVVVVQVGFGLKNLAQILKNNVINSFDHLYCDIKST